MIADKFREKTAGMAPASQSSEFVNVHERGKSVVFFANIHSEVADLIEAVEKWRGIARTFNQPVDDALTALREKMEELE